MLLKIQKISEHKKWVQMNSGVGRLGSVGLLKWN